MNDDVYTGYRYLMDMKDDRQYILRYIHGKPVSLDVVNQNGTKGVLGANEKILAYDDEISKCTTHNGALFQLYAYRIEMEWKKPLVTIAPVIYEVRKDPEIWSYEEADIIFDQDEENAEITKAAGIKIDDRLIVSLPERHITWVQDGPSAYPTVLHEDLPKLYILPLHGDRATKARGEPLPPSVYNRNAANDPQLQSMPFNLRDPLWTHDIPRPLTYNSVKAVIPTKDTTLGVAKAYRRKTVYTEYI